MTVSLIKTSLPTATDVSNMASATSFFSRYWKWMLGGTVVLIAIVAISVVARKK